MAYGFTLSPEGYFKPGQVCSGMYGMYGGLRVNIEQVLNFFIKSYDMDELVEQYKTHKFIGLDLTELDLSISDIKIIFVKLREIMTEMLEILASDGLDIKVMLNIDLRDNMFSLPASTHKLALQASPYSMKFVGDKDEALLAEPTVNGLRLIVEEEKVLRSKPKIVSAEAYDSPEADSAMAICFSAVKAMATKGRGLTISLPDSHIKIGFEPS
ncbi:MAG: hypothetical protein Q7V63_10230 [Gammaproteobacteria bacterium]|nr:hypothetical protein [Gammaproteobacteria bacterium]